MTYCTICGGELVFAGADDEQDEVYWVCPNELREDHLASHTIERTGDEDYDDGCPICGSSTMWEDCWNCGGQGYRELYDEDPLWYDEDDTKECEVCDGIGGWSICLNAKNHPKEAEPRP